MHAAVYLMVVTAGLHYLAIVLIDQIRKWQRVREAAKRYNTKPAPRQNPWDVFGIYTVASRVASVLRGNFIEATSRLFHKLTPTFSTTMLAKPMVFTSDPRNIRHVLTTGFADFNASKGVRDHLLRDITPHGILALDGEGWREARRLFRDLFSRTRDIVDMAHQEWCFQNLAARVDLNLNLNGSGKDGSAPFDLQPLLSLMALDIMTAFAIGEPANCLRPDLQSPRDKRFINALLTVMRVLSRDGFLGPLRLFISHKDQRAAIATLHRHAEDVIRERLALRKRWRAADAETDKVVERATEEERGQGKPPAPSCFLNRLLDECDDVAQLRDSVVTALLAGVESTTGLLATTVFLLARHQRVQDKLRAGVVDKMGYGPPSFDALRSVPYLRQVLNEAQRLYPLIPINGRRANKDTYLPVGGGPDGKDSVLVQKGAQVELFFWGAHRAAAFGDDTGEFRPERWETLSADAAAGFMPFNLGPRACPGQHFALLVASYFVVRLLQTFSRIENADSRPWTEGLGMVLGNKHGTVIKVVRHVAEVVA